MTPRLVHTGSVIVDMVMRIPFVPEPGGDILASSTELVAGGGLNTMVAARRDGLDVLYTGLAGTGSFGAIVLGALRDAGIEPLYAPLPDIDSGFCVALVDDAAERTFITHVGAEGRFGYEQLAGIPLRDGDMVYVTGYSLATEINAEGLARWLPEVPSGITVLVDPSPLIGELPEEAFAPLMARADILSANGREARIMAGTGDLDEAALTLAGRVRSGAAVVVRDGASPCRVVRADGELVHVPAFPARAVDTNGAGDAHAGVLMSGLARGLPLEQAVRRANAAAAIAVTRVGPTSSPVAAETDALLGGETGALLGGDRGPRAQRS